MGELKKTKSIDWLKLSLYRDKDGQRFYKRGEGSRIKRVPRWAPGKRFVRWTAVLAVLVIIGSIAYPPIMKYASNKVIEVVADQMFGPEELDELVRDPEIQKIMEQLEGNTVVKPIDDGSADDGNAVAPVVKDPVVGEAPVKGTDMVVEDMSFKSNEEALKFMLKKFEMSELRTLADKAQGGLTSEEKVEIKSTIMERLTQKEFESLKIIAAMEIKRRQGNLILEP